MKTLGVLCGGFGGVEIGAMQAGIKPIWSIELAPAIAAVAQRNLYHKIIVSDILDVDPHTMEAVYILHASPPCPNFSIAKTNGKETDLDIALACKMAQFIKILKPHVFTLENVWLYRKSQSWKIISDALTEAGYWFDLAHVNSADFGVPQTRKRMIVRAIRGGFVPYLPQPELWSGWYEAIEDLIPGLPEGQFAPWQWKSMPHELKTFLLGVGTRSSPKAARIPADTITSNTNQTGVRAFIVGGQYQTPNTVKNRIVQNRHCDSPIWTIAASEQLDTRAGLSQGRIVSMTPRCMARFQTLPDWYNLPESNKLACKGIGNMHPPLWYEKIARGLMVN